MGWEPVVRLMQRVWKNSGAKLLRGAQKRVHGGTARGQMRGLRGGYFGELLRFSAGSAFALSLGWASGRAPAVVGL